MKHMSKDTLNHRITPLLLSLFVGLGTIVSLWPSAFAGFTVSPNLAPKLMFLFLAGGMIFFLMSRNKLMVICFIGCALICYDLNEKDKSPVNAAVTNKQDLIRIGIYNLYANYQNLDESLDLMCNSNTDFISIKAIPNHQFLAVRDHLDHCGYHFHHFLEEHHPTSIQAVFSKENFPAIDSLYLSQESTEDSLFHPGSEKQLTFLQVFNPNEFKILKHTSVKDPMGIIQTYQLIHQAPVHVKKAPQKL